MKKLLRNGIAYEISFTISPKYFFDNFKEIWEMFRQKINFLLKPMNKFFHYDRL
jgi:hypothetical protein